MFQVFKSQNIYKLWIFTKFLQNVNICTLKCHVSNMRPNFSNARPHVWSTNSHLNVLICHGSYSKNYSSYKPVWRIPRLIVISMLKSLLLKINTITKFILFWQGVFVWLLPLRITLLFQCVNVFIHSFITWLLMLFLSIN